MVSQGEAHHCSLQDKQQCTLSEICIYCHPDIVAKQLFGGLLQPGRTGIQTRDGRIDFRENPILKIYLLKFILDKLTEPAQMVSNSEHITLCYLLNVFSVPQKCPRDVLLSYPFLKSSGSF